MLTSGRRVATAASASGRRNQSAWTFLKANNLRQTISRRLLAQKANSHLCLSSTSGYAATTWSITRGLFQRADALRGCAFIQRKKQTKPPPLVEGRQLKMILRSIRLALRTLCGRRGQQQRAIESMAQAKGGLHVSPQIDDNHLLIQNFAVRNPGSIGRQSDVDNSIRESKCRCYLIKDEGGMRGVANRNYESLWGARVGVVCHDGSCRFWEWDSETACFVPLSLSSR